MVTVTGIYSNSRYQGIIDLFVSELTIDEA